MTLQHRYYLSNVLAFFRRAAFYSMLLQLGGYFATWETDYFTLAAAALVAIALFHYAKEWNDEAAADYMVKGLENVLQAILEKHKKEVSCEEQE